MYVIVTNNINEMSITAKSLIDTTFGNYNDCIFTLDPTNKLFFSKKLEKNDIEYYKNITNIEFKNYFDEPINFSNLFFLPNLTSVSFINLQIEHIPNDIFNLTNILELCIYTENLLTKKQIKNIDSLNKLTNLTSMQLNCELFVFPKSILSLKKLQILKIHSNHTLNLPDELCNLKNLFVIEVSNSNKNILKCNEKMIILNLQNNFCIPHTISNLKILNCNYNSLNNLSNNIEYLSLGLNVFFPLNNLPFNLKKIKFLSSNDFIDKQFIIDNSKIPFGCKIKILHTNDTVQYC